MRAATAPGVALAATISVLAGCGATKPTPKSASVHTAITSTAPRPAQPKRRRHRPRPNPGRLPQTHQLPSARSKAFYAELLALWSGVRHDSLAQAMPAFFPEAAYVQVKAIGDPRTDFTDRLLAEYRLDLGAAHALLGPRPTGAELVGIHIPPGYAHWVPPGVCSNRVGYYELPNARLAYRQNGTVHSFGIASMISWRGMWYVVHLGAVVREAPGGVVDAPSSGVGVAAPSATC